MSPNRDRCERRTVLKGIAALGALGVGGVATATPGRNPGAKPNEILVGGAPSMRTTDLASTVESATMSGASVVHRNDTLGYVALELPDQVNQQAVEAVRSALANRPGVDYVEKNVTFETQVAPNDPRFGSQYAPQQVNADDAWDTTFGSEDVSLAVIDTGVQYTHPDLSAQYGSDKGHDFVDDDSDPTRTTGNHATHVSGCASATTDNDIGVAGISNTRLINARALGGSGRGSLSDIADAVQWAADQGVDLINMSLGGGGYTYTMKNAVSYADNQGVLTICAAGNDGSSSVSYPAAYDECMAISAIDPNEDLAYFSNYGPEIELAAPGVNVHSTYPTDDYQDASGTSMASPVAAGVAALAKAANPGLSNSELRQRLKDTAVDIGLSEDEQGAGRVDAANAVSGDNGGGGGDDPDLYCGTDTNANHEAAGRAYSAWGDYYYYAVGSDDYLGVYGSYESTLTETSEGYFEVTNGC